MLVSVSGAALSHAVVLHQEDGGLGISFVEGNTESGVEVQSISEAEGHTGKVCREQRGSCRY